MKVSKFFGLLIFSVFIFQANISAQLKPKPIEVKPITGESSTKVTPKDKPSQKDTSAKKETQSDGSSSFSAESYRTGKPYSIARSIPKNIESLRASNPSKFVKEICKLIETESKNDFEKAKMAHDVIAVLVSYDAPSFFANKITNQSWENVIKTKLAVCEGYAITYKKFCDTLGVECEIVSGYSRGVGYDLSKPDDVSTPNHAWNTVRVDGKWYLVDVTWDSGYLNGRTFKRMYSTAYLFSEPYAFAHSHFPTDSNFQLIEPPLTAAQFNELANLRPVYFDIVKNPSVQIKKNNQVSGDFVLEYDENKDYSFTYELRNSKGKTFGGNFKSQTANGRTKDTITFPESDIYLVTIFCFKGEERTGQGIGEFFVEYN